MEMETKERKEKLWETLSMKNNPTMYISDVNNGSVGKSKERKASWRDIEVRGVIKAIRQRERERGR